MAELVVVYASRTSVLHRLHNNLNIRNQKAAG